MDPHKRSATIEVMAGDETILGAGRFSTDRAGYAAMVKYAKQWPDRKAAKASAGTSHPPARRR
jgi:transposase